MYVPLKGGKVQFDQDKPITVYYGPRDGPQKVVDLAGIHDVHDLIDKIEEDLIATKDMSFMSPTESIEIVIVGNWTKI